MTAVVDPVVAALRAEITALDVRLLETVNARIETVEKLRRHKEQHGIAVPRPGPRGSRCSRSCRASTAARCRRTASSELVTFVLDLVKREVARE